MHSAGWTRAPFFVEKGRKERKEWRKEHGDLFKCQCRLVLKCLILAKEGGSAFFAAYQSGIDTAPHTDTSFMCVLDCCAFDPLHPDPTALDSPKHPAYGVLSKFWVNMTPTHMQPVKTQEFSCEAQKLYVAWQ